MAEARSSSRSCKSHHEVRVSTIFRLSDRWVYFISRCEEKTTSRTYVTMAYHIIVRVGVELWYPKYKSALSKKWRSVGFFQEKSSKLCLFWGIRGLFFFQIFAYYARVTIIVILSPRWFIWPYVVTENFSALFRIFLSKILQVTAGRALRESSFSSPVSGCNAEEAQYSNSTQKFWAQRSRSDGSFTPK